VTAPEKIPPSTVAQQRERKAYKVFWAGKRDVFRQHFNGVQSSGATMNSLRLKDLIVIFLFFVVLRATLTAALPHVPGSYKLDLVVQIVIDALLVLACVYQFKINSGTLIQIFGKSPGPIAISGCLFWATILLMFSLGENSLEAWTVAQFDRASAYRLWNFHEHPTVQASIFSGRLLLYLAATGVVAPIVEEFFFRGLLLRSLTARYGFHIGALTSSLAFAAMHFSQNYFLSTFVFSLSLCYIYYLWRSLWICIFIHAAFNILAFIHQNYFDIHWTRATDRLDSLADWRPELVCLTISLIAFMAFWRTYKRKACKSTKNLFDTSQSR
jgi:membrane protease YdiL (CAAX protease family)